MMKLIIMPGPAFCAASAVSTKMPVPMIAPTPSMVSWNAPSERGSDFFSAVARMASSDLTRPSMRVSSPHGPAPHGAGWKVARLASAPGMARDNPRTFHRNRRRLQAAHVHDLPARYLDQPRAPDPAADAAAHGAGNPQAQGRRRHRRADRRPDRLHRPPGATARCALRRAAGRGFARP